MTAIDQPALGNTFDAFPKPKVRRDLLSNVRVEYRPDIDGIRGLAVVAAIFFHANIGIVRGGYVGVELFMVVSGYLITSILAKEMAEDRFSLSKFFARRIRRLYPALFVMLAVTTLVAPMILIPMDLKSYGQSVVSTTLYISNVFFWHDTGYFDGPAELKVLLHTWSLAVEEQFYIFLPIVMLLTARFFQKRFVPVLATIAAISFIGCLWIMPEDRSAAFYLSPFRAWELLLGSLLAFGLVRCPDNRSVREAVSAGGLALILYCMLTYSERTFFPGAAAILPCLGTVMIVAAGTAADDAPVVNRMLASRFFVFFGLISYSLYLWHWPIFVFANYLMVDRPSITQVVLMMALALVIATLSWQFVELRFRRLKMSTPLWRVYSLAGVAMAVALIAGLTLVGTQGLAQKRDAEVIRLANFNESRSPLWSKCSGGTMPLEHPAKCTIGPVANTKLAVWGDSHAGALYGSFVELAKSGLGTLSASTSRCPPLIGIGPTPGCIETNRKVMSAIAAQPGIDTVVLAARWSFYIRGRAIDLGPAESNADLPVLAPMRPLLINGNEVRDQRALLEIGLRETISELRALGKRVIIVYPVPPTGHDIPSTLARLADRGKSYQDFSVPVQPVRDWEMPSYRLLDRIPASPDIARIYPIDTLCSEGRCPTFRQNEVLYMDSNHLSLPGAALLAPEFLKALGSLDSDSMASRSNKSGVPAEPPAPELVAGGADPSNPEPL